ncbi:MAG TPA: hypothetical protein EYQ50_29650 [Verrucomicrobiales bacterium]|nr:hypothetical protein [Verrucomicrobiales bacterium]
MNTSFAKITKTRKNFFVFLPALRDLQAAKWPGVQNHFLLKPTAPRPDIILLRIKFSDLNLGILHKLDAGQNMVPEGGRAEAVHGKSRVYTP